MIEPINPITLYGNGPNLTLHRMWLGSNLIPVGQNSFAPKEKRTNYQKILCFLFWENPDQPMASLCCLNEDNFISQVEKSEFSIFGPPHKGSSQSKEMKFFRQGKNLIVELDGFTAEYDWDHARRGFQHLFVKEIS